MIHGSCAWEWISDARAVSSNHLRPTLLLAAFNVPKAELSGGRG